MRLLIFVGVLALGFLVTFIVTATGRDSSYYYLERTFDMDDIGVKHPAGLAYSPTDDVLIVIDEADNGRDVALITRGERLTGAISLPDIAVDPINMAFDAQTNSLFLLDQDTQELVQIQVNLKEQPGSASEVFKRFDLGSLGLSQVQGITLDPNSGQLYVLDGDLSRLVGLTPDAQQGFDGALALDQGRVSQRGLRGLGQRATPRYCFQLQQQSSLYFERFQPETH